MQKVYWLAFGLGIALVSLSLAGCSSSADGASAVMSGEVTVRANEFKFEPASVKVEVGKPIKLILKNDGKIEHNMQIIGVTTGGKDIQINAKAGETTQLEFTPDKTGVFEMACTLPAHRDGGMQGKFEVVASSR